jgi:ABC-type polysaccharide/polyol phosphate transport system ATPase subunit
MRDTALRVHQVGKLYRIGENRHPVSLRETIVSKISAPVRRLKRAINYPNKSKTNLEIPHRVESGHIWALKDASFEITRGETVGIIGPNGSGKSTLLKILAEITEPTEGEIYVNGRLTALIELGAGFHPELSGRENLYLNGAILGLSKQQIDSKFFEILDFAELRDFIDTPLKHYSSGMAVRLGFSLAVHVDPDILLVDEVLAVGDAAFRRRCFAKIDEFVRAKKTIIIVSHNLVEVQRVARRLILIQKGTVQADDVPEVVIEKYASLLRTSAASQFTSLEPTSANEGSAVPIAITDLNVCGVNGRSNHFFNTHDEMQVQVRYYANSAVANPVFRVQIYRSDGVFCHGMNTARHGIEVGELHGAGVVVIRYPNLGLLQGEYTIHAAVFLDPFDELPVHQWLNPLGIRVDSRPIDGGGIFAMPTEWNVCSPVLKDHNTARSRKFGM